MRIDCLRAQNSVKGDGILPCRAASCGKKKIYFLDYSKAVYQILM